MSEPRDGKICAECGVSRIVNHRYDCSMPGVWVFPGGEGAQ